MGLAGGGITRYAAAEVGTAINECSGGSSEASRQGVDPPGISSQQSQVRRYGHVNPPVHTFASNIGEWGHHAGLADCDTACKACTADDGFSQADTMELECAGTDIADPEIAEKLCQSSVALDYDGPPGLESPSQPCDNAANPSPYHDSDDLPDPPQDSWQPPRSPSEWAKYSFSLFPRPLVEWIGAFEPSMACSFKDMISKSVEVLPVLTSYALTFPPADRWDAVAWLFGSKGLLDGRDGDMFNYVLYFMTARSSKPVFAKGGLKPCLGGLVEFFGSFLLLPDVGLFYGCFVLRSGAPGSQENYFIYTNLGLLRDL